MSLLSESLVEEWFNRTGYFTIRGIRDGVSEMDLLAVRYTVRGIEGRHVEVQVSTNPVSYISPLTDERSKILGKQRTSAWVRSPDILKESVAAWLKKKYFSPGKSAAREKIWPGITWSLEFVHGQVKHETELEVIRAGGIKTIPFHEVLSSLCSAPTASHKGGAGTDITEILSYYVRYIEKHDLI